MKTFWHYKECQRDSTICIISHQERFPWRYWIAEVALYLEDMTVLVQGRGTAVSVRLKKPLSFFDQLLSLRRADKALWKPHLVRLSPSANCLQFSLRRTQSPKVSTPRRIRQLSDIARITCGSIFSSANRLESVESPTFWRMDSILF